MRRLFLILITGTLAACVTPPLTPLTNRDNPLTQGNVQLTLRVGETTKAEVLETFGAPNLTTRDGEGREVWTYQRAAEVAQAAGGRDSVFLFLFGSSRQAASSETASRMMTLIIKFDAQDKVVDFRSRSSNF